MLKTYNQLGHMIVCERQLGSISHRVNVVSSDIADLTNLCQVCTLKDRLNLFYPTVIQAQGSALKSELLHVHSGMRQDLIDLVFGLNDIRMRLPVRSSLSRYMWVPDGTRPPFRNLWI